MAVWLGIEVKCGQKSLKKLVAKACENMTLGDLVAEHLTEQNGEAIGLVDRIEGYQMLNSSDTPMRLMNDLPIHVAWNQFNIRHVTIFVRIEEKEPPTASKQQSVFDVMMSMARKYDSLPEKRPESTCKNKLTNHLIDTMEKHKVGFRTGQLLTVGKQVVTTLAEALWYMDPHWEKLSTRAINPPDLFTSFRNFNDWRAQKKKMPRIIAEDLKMHADNLCDILAFPWFADSQFTNFRAAVSDLCSCFMKYHKFLADQLKRTETNHASPDHVRSLEDAWEMIVVEGGGQHVTCKEEYSALHDTLETKEEYEGISLEEFGPTDRYQRRHWLDKLQLPYPVTVWSYAYGNNLGTLNFVWKLPINKSDRSSGYDIDLVSKIKKDIPTYATRKMKSEFIDRYSKIPGMKAGILRNIYTFLTGDQSASSTSAEAQVDQRILEYLADSADPDLIWDLRTLNGRPKDPRYEPFWDELGRFLDEKSAVHERRHGDHLYMPIAISVEDLRQTIKERLPEGTPIPSESWIRMNFWPSNAHSHAAMAYTGRYKVKFAVQQRLTRAQHVDSKFAAQQFTQLKTMAVKWRQNAELFCMDDKAIVPVGDPNKPVSTGVRAHHGSLVPTGSKISALDHDFHVCGLVPSVIFNIDIPERTSDSFYNGHLHIIVKDKIFQPSSPMRHAAEFVNFVRSPKQPEFPSLDDDLNLHVPILLVYTDGGPDHRTTYKSVQMAWIAVFLALDLDLLVAARTAPSQSYSNPAERTMSLFNLALQNVALHRDEMEQKYESMMRIAGTIKAVRTKADKTPELRENLLESMKPVVTLLNDRFARLKWKGNSVQTGEPCTKEDMTSLLEVLKVLDPNLDLSTCLKDRNALADFMKRHCKHSHYMFQIKKCGDCDICHVLPPRLSPDDFANLHFVPDPVLNDDGKYKDFDEVYGVPTTDGDRPSLKQKSQTSERDQLFKSCLVSAKARNWILCGECGKRRVVYSAVQLKKAEEEALAIIQEELVYICGNTLFPESHNLRDKLVVKESISCESPMEVSYYSAVTKTFEPVCSSCGDLDVYHGPEIEELNQQYGTVRPICKSCLDAGKQPLVRCAVQVGKKRKRTA